MDTNSYSSRDFSSPRLWILLLLLVLFQTAPACAGEPRPPPRLQTIAVPTPLLAESWSWRKLFNPVQAALGSRRRMVQFATIGMCIGLYILMRK